jgi:protein-L-isoaspartate(D-aspartate) O-methyltransferase
MALFYRTVSVRTVLTLVSGLCLGCMFGLYLPHLVSAKSERVAAYAEAMFPAAEETSAQDVAQIADSMSTDNRSGDWPEYGVMAENSQAAHVAAQTYDGPGFARSMPVDRKEAWLSWMRANKRGDSPAFLEERWALARSFVGTAELKRPEDVRAFLLTPREHFVRARNRGSEYADTWLPIGYGATITDPDVVSMMTTTLAIQPGEKVLEIGTGSGYQSAILSYLTSEVYTIEIIKPLFTETDALYRDLEPAFPSYGAIKRNLGDGYYGWEKYAPFDKIIVTCAIDHIPPPLLKQLKAGGIMVLPLGPPGRQYIMEVKKQEAEDGTVTLNRRDVYNGLRVSFIPFRDEAGGSYSTSEDVRRRDAE